LFSCVPHLAHDYSIAGKEKKSKPTVSLITDQYRLSVEKTLNFQGREVVAVPKLRLTDFLCFFGCA
jgi:hypothetical protein